MFGSRRLRGVCLGDDVGVPAWVAELPTTCVLTGRGTLRRKGHAQATPCMTGVLCVPFRPPRCCPCCVWLVPLPGLIL